MKPLSYKSMQKKEESPKAQPNITSCAEKQTTCTADEVNFADDPLN